MLGLQQVPSTEVALSNIMATKQFKLFVAVPDGDMWRWRVSWPYHPGKCGMTSKELFATRQAAEWAAHVISGWERPSAVMVGAFESVPASAGQPAEMREEHVGE
jgi:uncharacterized short protein YbdD (DUF466 family)